ncbi:MAG: hypothetical protein J6336_10070 [Kiritimatiellae bacterium]|nr:hypothetical protein [Kiritimatiellia bacterium]
MGNRVFGVMVMCMAGLAGELMATTVDFTAESGKVRRALHSSGFGPMICSCPQVNIDAIKEMNFLYARTHDWALINAGQRVCDYYHIFPLTHLDAKDPKSYVFGPTDYLLTRTREETGLDIFFRLGTSIEHSGPKVHFNALIPEDFEKTAETFAGTIRHYNKGWANGFTWDIRYWEIWNEPDGENTMWCEPDGDAGKSDIRREKFIRFFVTCLKRIKAEFPEVKVGGPALCGMYPDYFRALLQACKDAGVAPDFISWHFYGSNVDWMLNPIEKARTLCDSFGFTKCELILNEWHYLGSSFKDLRSPDPNVQKRVWSGPAAHNGIDSACFTLSALARFQTSKLDQAYYYGCRHTGAWGFLDDMGQINKCGHALKLFGRVMRDCQILCPSTATDGLTVLAAKSADGATRQLLVVDYRAKRQEIAIDVKGAKTVVSAVILDYTHDLEPFDAAFADGKLVLKKPDTHSAAFLVTFTE